MDEKKSRNDNNWGARFEINVEISIKASNSDAIEKWIKRLAKIQKEYSCKCTLTVNGYSSSSINSMSFL